VKERERVCVCVCVCERERERERERWNEMGVPWFSSSFIGSGKNAYE